MTAVRLLAAAAFAGLVVGSGLLHGRHTGRWTPLPPIDGYTARLAGLPKVVGDWRGEDRELDADSLARGGIQGHVHRAFVNPRTGDDVSVLAVCGRPGPISAHTPDVCYRGLGYEIVGEPARHDLTAADGSVRPVWVARFRQPGPASHRELEVVWGWTPGGRLEAPGTPRISFARQPALFKLYVIRERRPGPAKLDDHEFLKAIVPLAEAAFAGGPAA